MAWIWRRKTVEPAVQAPAQAETIGGRFLLARVAPRTGGTAHVFRALDVETEATVAIKVYDGVAIDDELLHECFVRERSALEALSHPNVVKLIDAGYDETRGQHYLALEWLQEDLLAYLRAGGTGARWSTIGPTVLRPLLDGLRAAHARRVLHRDIKPANVMVAGDGTVKLTDFGVAKLLDSMRFGLTVGELHSRPYAAPERQGGETDARSDLYSLGVTIVDLLDGLDRRLPPDADPLGTLTTLDVPDAARGFLARLVATDPDHRPINAKLALAELNGILAHGSSSWGAPRARPPLRIVLQPEAIRQAAGVLRADGEADARRRIVADLTEDTPSIAPLARWDRGWERESAVPLELLGREVLYNARFDGDNSGTLIVRGASWPGADLLDRRRADGVALDHELTFGGRVPGQRDGADALIAALAQRDATKAAERQAPTEGQLFERWSALLDAKTDLERRREDPLDYHGVRREGQLVTFTVKSEIDDSLQGQAREVRVAGGRSVGGTVIEVGDGELGLEITRGNPDALPERGRLLADRTASRRAIDRQREALIKVRDGDAARADLGELLARPAHAEPLRDITVGGFLQDLDLPKQRAVQVALASPDFTVVQGPPGTGKTTFIAELIAQLLIARPNARVLLSSQTHVAVDNAVMKLATLKRLRTIRVGRNDKIDPAALELTVPEQLRRWHAEAQERSKTWLTDWGRSRGIDASALAAYATAAERDAVGQLLDRLDAQLRDLADEQHQLTALLDGPSTPVAADDESLDEQDALAGLQDEAEGKRGRRDAAAADHARLTTALEQQLGLSELPDDEELEAVLQARFPVDRKDLDAYRRLADLQDQWLVRFGQGEGFSDALLASAQVVAGTCVGLAGVLDDDHPFDLAIVDEVSKAAPTEALIPMAISRSWVLVGDERQLPPYVDRELTGDDLLAAAGLTRKELSETLFSQLGTDLPEDRRLMLSEQHRMLRPIGWLISNCFYGGDLGSSRPDRSELRCIDEAFPAPVTWCSTAHLGGRREKQIGKTFWNSAEVAQIRRLLDRLQELAARYDERPTVAVLSGYSEQAKRIRRDLRPNDPKWTHLAINVQPVDSFQGQQRDVVLFSVTRSNTIKNDRALGFLQSEERVNVALSRAQDALVIVGDDRFCARARGGRNPLAKVLRHIREADGCVIEEQQA
jgi:tRNA A-37 threonylcarbamoyl transferase component Bud32